MSIRLLLHHKNNSRSGFTLVELMIYMGLLSIFIVVMTDLLSQLLDVRTQSTAQSFVSTDGNFIRDRLAYDIRRSTALLSPGSPGETTSTFSLSISGSIVTFHVQDESLVRTVGGVSQSLTTSDVRIASFSALRIGNGTGNDTVRIHYSLQSKRTAKNLPVEQKTYSVTLGER